MIWIERDFKDHPVPTSLPWAGNLPLQVLSFQITYLHMGSLLSPEEAVDTARWAVIERLQKVKGQFPQNLLEACSEGYSATTKVGKNSYFPGVCFILFLHRNSDPWKCKTESCTTTEEAMLVCTLLLILRNSLGALHSQYFLTEGIQYSFVSAVLWFKQQTSQTERNILPLCPKHSWISHGVHINPGSFTGRNSQFQINRIVQSCQLFTALTHHHLQTY